MVIRLLRLISFLVTSPLAAVALDTGRPNACNLCHLDRSLDWTARHLNEWYRHPVPVLDEEQTTTSAAVLHLLKGDASQRAITAAAFAWQPAQQASGTQWIPPLLLIGMGDPYDAIRLISYRSLWTSPEWSRFTFDPVASHQDRFQAFGRVMGELERNMRGDPRSSVLLKTTTASMHFALRYYCSAGIIAKSICVK
ncbi:MAG: hypothetical protein O3B13_12560 [Planctomycetota bacterium]|nr:hypothetical protein [Planctomycetota bacterium]